MDNRLHRTVSVVFGLAFDVQKNDSQKSGFEPAPYDLSSNKRLYGELRLEAFASLLQLGFAQRLVIVGGNEARYKDEVPVTNRAWAIREMLIDDLGMPAQKIRSVSSVGNTGGNIAAMKENMRRCYGTSGYAVVSNFYHLPRIGYDLAEAGLAIRCFPAEAFLMIEGVLSREELVVRLGGGDLAERDAQEIQGIADKLRGTYQSPAG